MAIKVSTGNKSVKYKSSKKVIPSADIEQADQFDLRLAKLIREIESVLVEEGLLNQKNEKKDPLKAWYIIGGHINKFLSSNEISIEDNSLFWQHLYGRSSLISRGVPKNKVSHVRNDFKTASLLANLDLETVEKLGSWALCREVLSMRIVKDMRVLNWLLKVFVRKKMTRNQARPLLKEVNAKFKKVDTTVLNNDELKKKLKTLDQ